MIMINKERTVKVRDSIEMNVEILGNMYIEKDRKL